MDIASIYANQQTQYASEISSSRTKSPLSSAESGKGDTVDISEEGFAMAVQMRESKAVASADASSQEQTAGGDSGGGGKTDTSDQAEQLKSKILTLAAQLSSIASSGDGLSNAQASALQGQIASLQAQLAALESA